jgi:hypothetical protein
MKNQKWIILAVALVLIAGTAVALTWLRAHQKLGKPGLKAEAIPGRVNMKINLPERVAGFNSTNVPEPDVVLGYLPPDTSYAERCYFDTNGFPIYNTAILMGADRTSIHNADYCLPGQGWTINQKWVIGNVYQTPDGHKQPVSGLYVFWFVADGEQTTDNRQRILWLMRDLLRTGVLQRWAYISYFTICAPGQEDATFERVKNLIAHSVPEFQNPPPGR